MSQLSKGLKFFSRVLSTETLQEFRTVAGIDCAEHFDVTFPQSISEKTVDIENDGNNKEGEEEDDEYEEDVGYEHEADDNIESGGEDVDDATLDPHILKDIGENLMGSFGLRDCNTGDNFVLLPPDFCQGRLNGRNGSSACTVISLITGCLMARLDHLSFKETIPLYVGCIEAGNSLHDKSTFLRLEDAIDLISIPAEISIETNCLPNDLGRTIRQLFEVGNIIVVICNGYTVSFVKTLDSKIFFFDSHQHGEMGAFIAWVNDICHVDELFKYIIFNTSDDILFLGSIVY